MANVSTFYNTVSFPEYVVLQSLQIVIGIFGVIGNVVVLAAYRKFHAVRLLECSHLVAALAIGDLITGIGSIILGTSKLAIPIFNYYQFTKLYCISTAGIVQVGLEISQMMTAAIAIDRYIAMDNPLSYRAKNHRRFALIAFIVALLAGGATIILSVVGVDFNASLNKCSWTGAVAPQSNLIFLLFNATIGPGIAVIYLFAVRKHKKFRKNLVGDQRSAVSTINQAKTTTMLTILLAVYCVLVALPLTSLFLAITFKSVISSQVTYGIISPLAYLGMSLNSSINVIIYAQSSSNLKPFIAKVLKCKS